MILPTNLDINKNSEKHLNDTTSNIATGFGVGLSGQSSSTNSTNTEFNIDIDILDKSAIKKETYYKMKYIMNSLDKNWAIKKRENIFYLKNLDNSTKDIITEDYLNKRVIEKIYNDATIKTPSSDDINKEIKKQTTQSIQITQITQITQIHPYTHNNNIGTKKKEDIISLKDGILALKEFMNRETMNKEMMDMNKELRQEIYIMIFLMNALESGWSIRKKDNNFVFRKRHNHKKEVYSDNYLVNFLKNNLKNIIF
jgi:hypothetical protein